MQNTHIHRLKFIYIVLGLLLLVVALTAFSSLYAKHKLEQLVSSSSSADGLQIVELNHKAGFLTSQGSAQLRLQHPCEAELVFDANIEYTLRHLPLPWALLRSEMKISPRGVLGNLLAGLTGADLQLNASAAVTPLGSYRFDFQLPAVARRDVDSMTKVAASRWQGTYRAPAFSLKWHLPEAEYRAEGSALTLKDLAFEISLDDIVGGLGSAEFSLEEIAGKDGMISNLRLQSNFVQHDKASINSLTSLSADQLMIADTRLNDLVLKIGMVGIDAKSYFYLNKLLRDKCSFNQLTVVEVEGIQNAIRELLQKGPSFNVHELSAKSDVGRVYGQFKLGIEPYTASAKEIALGQHLYADGKFEIDQALLDLQQQQMLLELGFVQQSTSRLQSSFAIKKGNLTINSRAPDEELSLGLQVALASMDKMLNLMFADNAVSELMSDMDSAEAVMEDEYADNIESRMDDAYQVDYPLPLNIRQYLDAEYSGHDSQLAVLPVHLNGDEEDDLIVRLGGGYCGSAGCMMLILVSNGQDYGIAFSGYAQYIGLGESAKNQDPVLYVSQHGSYCGKVGADICESYLYWNGQALEKVNR